MKIEVKSLTVFKPIHGGVLTVYLNTNVTSGVWPFEPMATIKTDVTPSKFDEWKAQNFPKLDVKFIDEKGE